MDLFLNGDYRITQRAGWPLSYAAMAHPKLSVPYIEKLIKKLTEPDNHPAIARNILRMFQDIELPEKHQGHLLDTCFAFIINASQPVAIRAFAITVACRICKPHTELKNELLLVLNDLDQYPQQPAIKSRIKSALKGLKAANPKN